MNCEELYNKLISDIKKYHPSNDLSIVEKAYKVAKEAHGDQLRKSGEPYLIHPISVAIILASLGMDLETIVAGILHDVIEDTQLDYNDIVNLFSDEIAQLVDGVTKLDRIEDDSLRLRNQSNIDLKEDLQAENYRKMFLAMAKDIRVILIKVADRLHNMRTLEYIKPDKQKKTAQETLDIYAPLAHRLGISKIRYELEDLSFYYTAKEEYVELATKIDTKQSEHEEFVQSIVDRLKEKLAESKIESIVEGRTKHNFSIYKKMKSQNKTLDQILDLFAVRVIVNEMRLCYDVLGIAHENWTPMPGRFKDYIAMPKSNMYQSIHTTLIGPKGEPFEVQIRTKEMHKVAEYGIAAHWRYKSGQTGTVNTKEAEKLNWLKQILDWQRDVSDNREYLDALKVDLNVYKENVYCFTPTGAVISLLSGSSPIDFAYAIHSAVGNKMIGARVNGKIVTFDYVLQTGDRVEIITSQNSKGPSLDWLKLVKTNQARNKINQWFKKENKDENIQRGKESLEREAKKKNVSLSEILTDAILPNVLNRFSMRDWDSLCAAVGHGGIKEDKVINRILHEVELKFAKTKITTVDEILQNDKAITRSGKTKSGIYIDGIGDIDVRFSKCCSPVPGDEVVAFTTRGRGISIHRTDCVNIVNLDEVERKRLLEAEWHISEFNDNVHYRADMKITCDEKPTFLTDISKILSDEHINVKSLQVRTDDCEITCYLGIEITGREQLNRVCSKILRMHGMRDVQRITT